MSVAFVKRDIFIYFQISMLRVCVTERNVRNGNMDECCLL